MICLFSAAPMLMLLALVWYAVGVVELTDKVSCNGALEYSTVDPLSHPMTSSTAIRTVLILLS